jgi:asparagine synthase (glutamine-hydrolysing)
VCGICGVYNYGTGEPASEPLVRAMTAAMTHRGPDDDGLHLDGPLGLGMRRLSIIDLAGGAQPIANEDGSVWTVFNGEIYNFRELRAELEARGHIFTTRTDTEVIVHAYEQWGLDALARLNGMFGLALWDARTRRLVLARDPFGVKPLYYHDDGRTLRFGSEIRAILRDPAVPRAVDPRALGEFLSLTFVPAPRTTFAGIAKLLPGHALICTTEGIRLERFHRVVNEPFAGRSEDGLAAELAERIAAAVRRQMVADVPVGAMLSGGVDSATVAAIMTEAAGGPIATFTVGFAGDFAENELDAARATARRLGSDHHELVIGADEYAAFLPHVIRSLEEPVATTSTLPFFKVCELARRHVKVVLTGQGADEPFAGYPRYLGERYGFLYRALPHPLRRGVIAPTVERLPRNEQLKRSVRALGAADPRERLPAVYAVIDGTLKRRLLRDGLAADEDGRAAVARWQADVAGRDGLSQMLYVDARLSLPDNLLLYGDKLSMAASLEARVPFLDLELMAFVERIPPSFKIRGRTQKHILKRAVARWVPREVITRRKVGFATPIDGWFRGVLGGELEERLLTPGSACRTYFRPETVRQMIADHRSGRHDHKRALFALLTFELWHEQFIAPAVARL